VNEGIFRCRVCTVVDFGANEQMIWLLTVVTFIGVMVTAMLALWFFSQKDQIRAALRGPEQQLPETPPGAAHLLLAQIENRDSPIAIGCPAANVSFVLAGGRRLVIEGPSKPSNTRRVHLLCGISESVRNSGQRFGMTNKPSPESTVRTGHSASSLPETDSLLYLAVGARATDVVLETALSSCSQPLSR